MSERSENIWTVEVQIPSGEWTIWSAWCSRGMAEFEKSAAIFEGYPTRIVTAGGVS